jgi:hypothetical protein
MSFWLFFDAVEQQERCRIGPRGIRDSIRSDGNLLVSWLIEMI